MWELSISVEDVEIARFVFQTLKSQSEELGGVVTCYEEYNNIFIIFACPFEEKARASVMIERCVIKAVTKFYKDKFLTNNLRLPIFEDMSLTAFKKALINFDKETDFYIISKNLDLDKNLQLDSFYNFKLKPLRQKWAELITLANENSEYLVSNDAFFDLLHFLIDNLEVCEEEVNVFQDENGYFLSPENSSLASSSLTKENLVGSLIELCPKKINFFCANDDNTAGFLTRLFEERMNVCYNKNILFKR